MMGNLIWCTAARRAGMSLTSCALLWGIVAAVGSAAAASDGGQWQGVSYPRAGAEPAHSARFYVTDTGGSGGGFGRGDPHHHLGSIDFWNRHIGWACGHGGVFKSEDGGLSWTRVKPRGGWSQVRLAGPQDVWLLETTYVDRQPVTHLWHSTDAGQNWQEPPLPEKLIGGFCLYCRGRQRWVFSGRADGMNYASADGGESWQRINFQGLLAGGTHLAIPADAPTDTPEGPSEGFVAYVFGHRAGVSRSPLVKSSGGDRGWEEVTLPADLPANDSPKTMVFATSWKGWLGFSGGRILFTPDGGHTWQWHNLPTDQSVIAIWMDQAGHGFAAVANGPTWGSSNDPYVGAYRDAVYETWDDGQTWTPVLSGYKQVNAFVAVDADHVWGAGLSPTNVPNDLIVIWNR
ncbi:MAG TPA: hypothetical protein VHY91_27040 [Pirellulales bacterium]|nr:hypothetical protein [Pirellulales bacterium]